MLPDHSPDDFPVPVSHETRARLEQYLALLNKWQKTINLVSPGTLPEAWERHFVDSAQIAPLLPAGAFALYDLGSGAGFPGLVLAIMRPDIRVHLVESDERKAAFLQTVSRETGAGVTVHNCRIEALPPGTAPDVVTARALAALPQLLAWALPWAEANPALSLLLPKGKNAVEEVETARAHYNFVLDEYPSITAHDARILRVSALAVKPA